jgi:hypothetical protein
MFIVADQETSVYHDVDCEKNIYTIQNKGMGLAIIINNALKITSKNVNRMQSLFFNDQKLKNKGKIMDL